MMQLLTHIFFAMDNCCRIASSTTNHTPIYPQGVSQLRQLLARMNKIKPYNVFPVNACTYFNLRKKGGVRGIIHNAAAVRVPSTFPPRNRKSPQNLAFTFSPPTLPCIRFILRACPSPSPCSTYINCKSGERRCQFSVSAIFCPSCPL